MKGLLKNLALLLVTVTISLVIGELAGRFVFRDITTTSDNRSYFALKWKAANIHLNSFGYRDREFNRIKPAGAYRIAFIGDSFTFGQGIQVEDRMSNILEAELRKRRPGTEVLNFGNAGNNTADEVRVLQKVLPEVKPDFVLLQWFINDVEYRPPVVAGSAEAAPIEESRLSDWKMTMRNKSVLYFLAAEVWHRFLDRMGSGYVEDMQRRVGDPNSHDAREAEKSLVEFFETSKSHGVPVGIVLVPESLPLNGKPYPFLYLHERVHNVCSRENVQCVDLLQTFEPYMKEDDKFRLLWVNRFDSHMGPMANRLAANRLLEVFGPTWTASATPASSSPPAQ